jgi:hypothetical protein
MGEATLGFCNINRADTNGGYSCSRFKVRHRPGEYRFELPPDPEPPKATLEQAYVLTHAEVAWINREGKSNPLTRRITRLYDLVSERWEDEGLHGLLAATLADWRAERRAQGLDELGPSET